MMAVSAAHQFGQLTQPSRGGAEMTRFDRVNSRGPTPPVSYDDTGVRCTMLRGGTSRGLYFEAVDLPADPSERDDLLLRLMGTPDARQIDGLGGATSLTSKVAVVGPSADPDVDVDYLFLQLGVDEAMVSDRQNCGNILAGVGPFAVERGMVAVVDGETSVRIRMVNSDSVAVATFPTPSGRPDYRGDVGIAGVPGTAPPVVLAFSDTEGSATGSLLPTGRVRDAIDGSRRRVWTTDAGRRRDGRVLRAERVRDARGAGRRSSPAGADRRLPHPGS